MMRPFDDPSELSSEQRHCELARVLAAGILRLRQRRLLAGEPAASPRKTVEKSPAAGLEVSGQTVLSVTTG